MKQYPVRRSGGQLKFELSNRRVGYRGSRSPLRLTQSEVVSRFATVRIPRFGDPFGFHIPNAESEVRTITIESEPWFVGKDVAMVLGYVDIKHAILDHVDTEDRVNSKTQGQNDPELGQRGAWLINESGLYSLILSSKLPQAKEFKRWITHDVIPAIRKAN